MTGGSKLQKPTLGLPTPMLLQTPTPSQEMRKDAPWAVWPPRTPLSNAEHQDTAGNGEDTPSFPDLWPC